MRLELFNAFAARASMGNHFEIRLTANQRRNAVAQERMIVDDKNAD
jgi:hypothetical protein